MKAAAALVANLEVRQRVLPYCPFIKLPDGSCMQAERSRVEREIHLAQSAHGASALVLEQQQVKP